MIIRQSPNWEKYYFIGLKNLTDRLRSVDFRTKVTYVSPVSDSISFDQVEIGCTRIPTVKLKIPGKAFLKSESRRVSGQSFSQFFHGSVLAKSQQLPLIDSLDQNL